jgi:site-specific DNA recombinase
LRHIHKQSTLANMRRALGVTRLSVLTKETTSPQRQQEIISDAAARRECEIVGWADDLDISATKYPPKKRPKLKVWLEQRLDEFDEIIFWRLDRFVRKPGDLAQMIDWAREHRKGLVSATEQFDLDDPWGEAIAYITAIFARMESVNTSIRVAGSHKALRERKRWGGGNPPYGYTIAPNPDGPGHVLVLDLEAAVIIREAVNRVIAGEALNSIVADFNRRQLLCPRDYQRALAIAKATDQAEQAAARPVRNSPWRGPTLNSILRSPALLGYVVHKGKQVEGDDGMPLTLAVPIISETRWDSLQRALSDPARSVRKERTQSPSLLLRVAHCALCGQRLYRQVHVASGREYNYYRCPGSYMGAERRTKCESVSIRGEELDEEATATFLRQVGHVPEMVRVYEPGNDNAEVIARVRRSLATVRTEYDSGGYSYPGGQEDYDARVNGLAARLRHLSAEPVIEPGYKRQETGRFIRDKWLDPATTVVGRRKLMTDAGFAYMAANRKDGTRLRAWSLDPEIAERARAAQTGELLPAAPATAEELDKLLEPARRALRRPRAVSGP